MLVAASAGYAAPGFTLKPAEWLRELEGCPGIFVPPDRDAHHRPEPFVTISATGTDTPVLEYNVPANPASQYAMGLSPDGQLYCALNADPFWLKRTDLHLPETGEFIWVYAYVSPGRFADLCSNPTTDLRLRAEDLPTDGLVSRLLDNRTGNTIWFQAMETDEKLLNKLREIRDAPQTYRNEPWKNPYTDPNVMRDTVAELLNKMVGVDDPAPRSRYWTQIYQNDPLPFQIVELMRQIYEMGGQPNAADPPRSGPDGEGGQAPGQQPVDPWANFRTGAGAPADTSGTPSPEAVSYRIRLLNRLLIERELAGLVHGTYYDWVKVVPGCDVCGVQPGLQPPDGGRNTIEALGPFRPMMCIRIRPDGAAEVLLGKGPTALSQDGLVVAYPVYSMTADGSLTKPEHWRALPADSRAAVTGESPRWVDAKQEGIPIGSPLQ